MWLTVLLLIGRPRRKSSSRPRTPRVYAGSNRMRGFSDGIASSSPTSILNPCGPRRRSTIRCRPTSSTFVFSAAKPFAREAHELGPHAELQPASGAGAPAGRRVPRRSCPRRRTPRRVHGNRHPGEDHHAAVDRAGQDVHARRSDEVADEGVTRALEQLHRRADLHHRAVVHHHHRVGEGEGLGLVVGDVDHGDPELPVEPPSASSAGPTSGAGRSP